MPYGTERVGDKVLPNIRRVQSVQYRPNEAEFELVCRMMLRANYGMMRDDNHELFIVQVLEVCSAVLLPRARTIAKLLS